MTRRRVALAAGLAMVLVLAGLYIDGGRRAHGRFDGELAWQRPHADAVAAWATSSAGERSTSGAGDLFDQEWTLVSCQMAVLGLGQLVVAHPELRDDYLPAMQSCSSWMLTPDARAFGTGRWGEDALGPARPEGSHAYLGYVALALAMHRRVDPDVPWAGDHDRMLEVLARSVEGSTHRIRTYPGETYPADIAAVIGALGLAGYDTTAAVARFRVAAVHPQTGLLYQSLHPSTGAPGIPRGSGTAIASYFLSFADPQLSRQLYGSLQVRRAFGVSGVREYPDGVSGWGDVDSGPVVFGLGVSTTGFALAGARQHGDRPTFVRLHRTAGAFGLPVPTPSGRWYLTGGSIGNAILLAMMTAPRP